MRRRLVLLAVTVMLASAAGCGDDDDSAADAAAPVTTFVSTTTTTTTTTPRPTVSVDGSVQVEDGQGYTYKAEVDVGVMDPSVDVSSSPPGEAQLIAPVQGTLTVENTTNGRDLPQQTMRVAIGYTPADYATVGLRDLEDRGCPNTDGYCSLGGGEFIVSALADGEGSVALEWPGISSMSEERADATLQLLDSGRPLHLVVVFDSGIDSVSACSGMAVYVQEEFSMDVFELCGGPKPSNLSVFAEFKGQIEEGGTREFTFEAVAGTVISVQLTSVSPWYASVAIAAPSGAEVPLSRSSSSNLDEEVELTESGMYKVLLSAPTGAASNVGKVEKFSVTAIR